MRGELRMGSSEFSRRRRWPGIAVEVLEGRTLLSSVSTTGVPQVQPTGVHSASVQPATSTHATQSSGNVGDALNVGGKYTKALFSSATGNVIADYTKALLRGNGKELRRLGNSSAVKQSNANFANVTNSSQATAVSNSFHKFGHDVSHDVSSAWHRIFG
jgi:hypothetical protein